jgi:hypothetical protein
MTEQIYTGEHLYDQNGHEITIISVEDGVAEYEYTDNQLSDEQYVENTDTLLQDFSRKS